MTPYEKQKVYEHIRYKEIDDEQKDKIRDSLKALTFFKTQDTRSIKDRWKIVHPIRRKKK